MIVEVGQTPPASFDILPVWRRHNPLSRVSVTGDDALGLHSHPRSHSRVERLAEVPRFSSSEAALKVLLAERAAASSASLAIQQSYEAVAAVEPNTVEQVEASAFTFSGNGASASFDFTPGPAYVLARGVKRLRHGQDVDGPNTAGLSCKKRRLRAQLITSRLSQPFSQPATHILNREGLKSGDKRFLKIATSIDMARRVAHLHATSFLRFSLMNSIRKRLGLVGRPGVIRPGNSTLEGDEMDTTSKAPWQPQSIEAVSGGRYLQPSENHVGSARGTAMPPAAQERPSAPLTKATIPVAKAPTCRLSKPAALPRPSADAVVAHERISPRIHPVGSPELRPVYTAYDDLDEDCFAFLHPEDDGLDDVTDDPEHVYSDFSVIFGGGASHAATATSDDHSYEEYLDELDGISWVSG